MSLVRVALLAVVIGLTTWAGGWTAVPLVAFLWGAWRRTEPGAALGAGVAAAAAWAGALAIAAFGAPVMAVAERIGGLTGMPGVVVVAVMVVFAFALAWSAAEVGRALMQWGTRRWVPERE